MANTNYQGHFSTTQGSTLATGIEKLITNDVSMPHIQKRPLLRMIWDNKLNFRTGSKFAPKLLIPVFFRGQVGSGPASTVTTAPAVAAVGSSSYVTGRAQNNPLGAVPYILNDHTQAEFLVAQLEAGYYVTYREEREFRQASRDKKLHILQTRKKILMEEYEQTIATQLGGSAAGTQTAFGGLDWMVSASNTVGNIAQSTTPLWQSYVDASGGSLTRTKLNAIIQLMRENRNSACDLILASSNIAGNDLWSTMAEFVDQSAVVSPAKDGKGIYGFDNYIYRGAVLACDQYLPANSIYFLDTSKFHYEGDEGPSATHVNEVVGNTSTRESGFVLCGAFGIESCYQQGKWTGINA